MAEVDDLIEPEALMSYPQGRQSDHRLCVIRNSATPSYRRNILRWIAKAKRDSTKEKYLLTFKHMDRQRRGALHNPWRKGPGTKLLN